MKRLEKWLSGLLIVALIALFVWALWWDFSAQLEHREVDRQLAACEAALEAERADRLTRAGAEPEDAEEVAARVALSLRIDAVLRELEKMEWLLGVGKEEDQ